MLLTANYLMGTSVEIPNARFTLSDKIMPVLYLFIFRHVKTRTKPYTSALYRKELALLQRFIRTAKCRDLRANCQVGDGPRQQVQFNEYGWISLASVTDPLLALSSPPEIRT